MPGGIRTASVLVCALLGLTLCGCSDDAPTPRATSTTASPTPTTPAQPPGEHGVTYDIQNWDEYADDPAVLAWKKASEGVMASVNQHKVVDRTDRLFTKTAWRPFLKSIQFTRAQDLHVPVRAVAHISSARTTATKSRVVACVWGPSAGFYNADGSYYGQTEEFWVAYTVALREEAGAWTITKASISKKCAGLKDAP